MVDAVQTTSRHANRCVVAVPGRHRQPGANSYGDELHRGGSALGHGGRRNGHVCLRRRHPLANTITNVGDTRLDGTGHQVTISGNNAVRVFYVNTNVSLTLINLTIANGLSGDGCGGGIYNEGMLNAANCHFVSNRVQGAPGAGLTLLVRTAAVARCITPAH